MKEGVGCGSYERIKINNNLGEGREIGLVATKRLCLGMIATYEKLLWWDYGRQKGSIRCVCLFRPAGHRTISEAEHTRMHILSSNNVFMAASGTTVIDINTKRVQQQKTIRSGVNNLGEKAKEIFITFLLLSLLPLMSFVYYHLIAMAFNLVLNVKLCLVFLSIPHPFISVVWSLWDW